MTTYEDLSWDHLTTWAGRTIVSRGQSYKSRVRDLARTESDGLLAWVDGTHRYATHVWLNARGKLEAACSCPYDWGPCKHAVATILAYLDAVKAKQSVPQASAGDPREKKARLQIVVDEDDDDFEEGEKDEWDEEFDEEAPPDLSHLESLTKQELIDLVGELAESFPEAGRHLARWKRVKNEPPEKTLKALRKEILQLGAAPQWRQSWSKRGRYEPDIPDYSGVLEKLRALLAQGRADDVVAIGEELFAQSRQQLECQDECEISEQIEPCMEVVGQALRESSLSGAARILWLAELHLADDYSLLEDRAFSLDAIKADKQEWAKAAESLAQRMATIAIDREKGDRYHDEYQRKRVMHFLIKALERSGQKKKIISILEQEAPITNCYPMLVDRLIEIRRKDDARTWAIKGYERTVEKWPGIAAEMERRLREMAERDGDHKLAAAFRFLEFIQHREASQYRALAKAAESAGVWPQVRSAVLRFLETGERPDLAPPNPARKSKSPRQNAPAWPLPPTGLPFARPYTSRFPDIGPLLDIALYEKQIDDILKWHERGGNEFFVFRDKGDAVAEAVKDGHPDIAIDIWKRLAEGHVIQTNAAAYDAAAPFLKKVKAAYQHAKRQNDWELYLAQLRAKYKPKRNFMKILDSLEGKRIIDG